LQDTLGKVAKLLGNDLARAEEEYAEHLNSYRLYFKGLRDREEKFSALKKNKHALQGRIDSTEKKLAKMSPENKELANTQNRLMELRNEMSGMEYAVMNEESALSDHRRQTARAAVNHKVRRSHSWPA
jgi:DNA repair ATPase RecN